MKDSAVTCLVIVQWLPVKKLKVEHFSAVGLHFDSFVDNQQAQSIWTPQQRGIRRMLRIDGAALYSFRKGTITSREARVQEY